MGNELEFKVEVQGVGAELRVESFNVTEKVSEPYRVTLSLLSPDADITYETIMRRSAALSLYGQGMAESRIFHGMVSEFRYLGQGRRFSRYELVLVPHAWFLSQRQDCRIFQNQSVQDIVTAVFSDAGITDYRWELSADYSPREYILQYRESDLKFVQRLLAEHGIWYYFEHSAETHTMVLLDSNDAIKPMTSTPVNASHMGPVIYHGDGGGTPDREHVFNLETSNRVRTGSVAYGDYNYDHPRIPQGASSSREQNPDLAEYDYPGRYTSPDSGNTRVGEWLATHEAESYQIEGASCVMRLTPGYSFDLSQHPRDLLNRDFTLLAVMHHGHDPQVHEEERNGLPTTYDNRFVCIPRDTVFRAPKHEAPVVDGPQTAVVVGPGGEEIYTDEQGRIKVQFHWDRYGSYNEESGCWIRVSQSMAAPNWGAVYLPRIGHEVVVTFLEGDPDRPLVTGAVYHGLHHPPYSLPENKTRTVFRTQTHKGDGYNELSFEDEASQEEIYFHAQRDMSTKVLRNRYRDIGEDEFLKVGRHQTNEVDGNHSETIKGHKTTQVDGTFTEVVEQDVTVTYNANETNSVARNVNTSIGQNRTTKIGQNDELSIGENSKLSVGMQRTTEIGRDDTSAVGGNLTVSVTGNTSYQSDRSTQIISGDKIVLKTGASQLTMTSDGSIKLSGNSISITGTDKVLVNGAKVAIN